MIETILCILKGDFIIGKDCDKIEASYKAKVVELQSEVEKLQGDKQTLMYNGNVKTADLASALKQLSDANARAEHLQAAVENLRGDLSVSNGSRDRAHIKISAAIKALQS